MRTRLLPESEAIILAGAGRAILLQLADPAVGYGVARHSDFASNPMGRLHGTLMYVYAVMAGTPSARAAASTYVTRMHGPVHGPGDGDAPAPRYDANDPRLQLWVAATLYDTAITVHDRVLGHLPEADADAAYSRYASLGSALRMPRDLWPSDRAAFRRYWQETVETLSVDDVVRAQADALWRATEAPLWVRSLMPLMRFLTAGLLPERVRAEYRMAWDARSQRRFDRLWSVVVPLYAALPAAVRRWPQQYYLRRLRRLTASR